MGKSAEAFRTISEVAAELDVPQHVLRFWETRFTHVKPLKRGGGRRYYRPEDVNLLRGIRRLLYADGFTIRGVQKILKEKGVGHVAGLGGAQAPRSVTMVDGGSSGAPVERVLPSQRLTAAAGTAAKPDKPNGKSLGDREVAVLKRAREELAELRDMLSYAREGA